ncbi:NAD(P)-binding protein [Aureobasidium subglaciale]|nr:NAD(P)-binding protein [Aureobasidium subglaciale]
MGFIYSQLFQSLPVPTQTHNGKTVLVTGSNVGLGKEAARHFVRLGAAKVILAVRDLSKGIDAAKDILETTGRESETVEVWELDMSNYNSVQALARRASTELPRLDIVLANAGVAKTKFETIEDNEASITINVISTLLLVLLLMPKLKETAASFKTRPTLTITSSEVHGHTTFPEKSAPDGEILSTLAMEEKADMTDRYPVSKLLEVFMVRSFAEKYPSNSFPVTLNCVNPGLCHSNLARNAGFGMVVIKAILARSTEVGSRALIHAASSGSESHGHYLSDCSIKPPSRFVVSEEGKSAQDRVWKELVEKCEVIRPGIMERISV